MATFFSLIRITAKPQQLCPQAATSHNRPSCPSGPSWLGIPISIKRCDTRASLTARQLKPIHTPAPSLKSAQQMETLGAFMWVPTDHHSDAEAGVELGQILYKSDPIQACPSEGHR